MVQILTLTFLAIFIKLAYSVSEINVSVDVGGIAEMPFESVANYRRLVKNVKGIEEEHIYRVCNGKNKKTCGFWENAKTKKKVSSGVTTYNKNKKALIIKKVKANDFGKYMTGNKKQTVDLVQNLFIVEY